MINIAAAFCFLADRLLKALAMSFPDGWGRRGVAEFALFLNKGIAFSIGLPKPLFWLALGAAFLVIFLVYRQALQKKRWLSAGKSFAFGLAKRNRLSGRSWVLKRMAACG